MFFEHLAVGERLCEIDFVALGEGRAVDPRHRDGEVQSGIHFSFQSVGKKFQPCIKILVLNTHED